jgi:hypothetical protein
VFLRFSKRKQQFLDKGIPKNPLSLWERARVRVVNA